MLLFGLHGMCDMWMFPHVHGRTAQTGDKGWEILFATYVVCPHPMNAAPMWNCLFFKRHIIFPKQPSGGTWPWQRIPAHAVLSKLPAELLGFF